MDALWVSEHGWIRSGQRNRCLDGGDLELEEQGFRSLEVLLEDARQDESRDDLPLHYARRNGRPAFKVRNFVGVIRTGSGQQIEVLPKLARHDTPEDFRRVLIRMLTTLKGSPFNEAAPADLDKHRMPLFELLLRYYLDQVAHLVRRGIAQSYVERQSNLSQLRGKLLIRENIRHNASNAARFYCEYEEFLPDRPVNRLIKSGLVITARLSRLPRTQQLCRELLDWFETVSLPRDWRMTEKQIRWDRNVSHYRKAMPPCRMLHERLNPLTSSGDNRALAMLFPMERVFEDYVGHCLRRQFRDYRIRTQAGGRHLVDNHEGKPIFALRPDFVLKSGHTIIIADAKWKLLNQDDKSNKYGISQADMYQLFAYANKCSTNPTSQEVWMIYPAHASFERPLPEFTFSLPGPCLRVLPLDLDKAALIQ